MNCLWRCCPRFDRSRLRKGALASHACELSLRQPRMLLRQSRCCSYRREATWFVERGKFWQNSDQGLAMARPMALATCCQHVLPAEQTAGGEASASSFADVGGQGRGKGGDGNPAAVAAPFFLCLLLWFGLWWACLPKGSTLRDVAMVSWKRTARCTPSPQNAFMLDVSRVQACCACKHAVRVSQSVLCRVVVVTMPGHFLHSAHCAHHHHHHWCERRWRKR